MATSGKEKKREGTSLEDQNAAAIQCIVDAKISSNQLQSNVCPSMPTSTVYTQTFIATSSGGNCHEKQEYYPGQLMQECFSNAIPTFLDNNASFSLNTGTNSNYVTNPSPLKMQLSAPLVATSQPSLSAAPINQVMTVMLPGTTGPVKQAAAHSNQVMTVMLPGTTGPVQQAATCSGIPLYPPCEEAASHLLATSSSSQVVAITTPGPQNVNSAVMDYMSTVMCGNDDVIPHFITVPHPDS